MQNENEGAQDQISETEYVTKLYKLTDYNNCTQAGTQWGPNVRHTADWCRPAALCTSGVLHAYTSPLLAVLLNPIHANILAPHLWEAEGVVVVRDWGKVGCRQLTTTVQLPVPAIATTQKVAFGILCVQALVKPQSKAWQTWATNWLNNVDRSHAAARYAARYAAADAAAGYAAADAAEAALYAADAAADAAAALYAADAAALYAADADAAAARYAAAAARYAAAAVKIQQAAERAMSY